jgi:asparagine synthase (glutamine-hydrolysing)
MCGILGFLTEKAGRVPGRGVLDGMRDTLSHRGPDDAGSFTRPLDDRGPFVYLGHRRLSIIDLAGGHQPLSNEDGTIWVVLNGEIYNFLEIRKELESLGHRFKTRSDTEVIAHAYEEYGEACLERLSGMYAFAVWDEPRERLLLARDRAGKKPLYYSLVNGVFSFGSELKALMAFPGFPREVAAGSLAKYLFHEFIPAPHTIFTHARKLPPASSLTWEKGTVSTRSYWSPFAAVAPGRPLSEEVASRRLEELLGLAVKRRLISDVPLGVFLSGGIDSSAIAALAVKHGTGKVKTFSISFEDPSFDESRYARLVSRHLGTDHFEQRMGPQDLIQLVPRVPDLLDEPMADASILPTYLLSRFTRDHVTVALGGDGGDELLAGYPTYLAHRMARVYQRTLKPLHPFLQWLGNRLPVSDDNISFDFKVKKFLSGIDYPEGIRNALWLGAFGFDALEKILSPALRPLVNPSVLTEEISGYEREYPGNDPDTLIQFLDLKLYLQEAVLVKVDRASMAASLEVRAPFLDREVMEFLFGLPFDFKVKGRTSKYLLKKAMEKTLPAEIVHRKKKGFGIPLAKWVKGPLRELFADLLSPARIKREGFFDPKQVDSLLQDHWMGRKDNRKPLWTLLVWELWLERYRPSI